MQANVAVWAGDCFSEKWEPFAGFPEGRKKYFVICILLVIQGDIANIKDFRKYFMLDM